MLARFQAAGGTVKWDSCDTDKMVSATFSHPGRKRHGRMDHRNQSQGRKTRRERRVEGNSPRHASRPRHLRVFRTVFPGVLAGMYTPEEARDMLDFRAKPPDLTSRRRHRPSRRPLSPFVTSTKIAAIKKPKLKAHMAGIPNESYGWKKTTRLCIRRQRHC